MSSDFRDAVRLSVSRAGAMLGVLTRLLSRATAAATFCACVSISAAPPKAESLGSSVSDGEICTTRPEPDTFACIDSTSRKEGEPFLSTPRSHTPSDSDSEPRRIGRPPVLGKDRDVVYYRAIVDPETGATSYVRFVRAERIPLLNAPDDWHVVDGGETGGAFDRRKFQRLVTTGWPTGTLRWLYNDSGRPSSLLPTANDAVHRIRLNMAKWQNVCGIRFVYDGVTSTPPSTANWMSDSFRVAAWEDLQSSVGGVVNTMTSGGQFVDADMRIDNVQVPSAGLGELDLVLLHEIGHWLGLAHSNVEGAVMSGPSAPPLISTTYSGQTALQADDVAGCVSLYGASPVAINVSVAPTDPFLGAVVVGQGFVDRVYTATNLQATAVTALGLEVAGRGFSLVSNGCGSVLAAGASCGFTVRFTTQQYGLSQGTITLFDSAYAWAKSISVTAAGAVQVSASLAVSPTVNATFPQTLVGAVSDSQTFRWTNLGATPTTISAISLSTADFQVTSSNCAGATLRSWEECEASVVFTPQSGGVRSATLSLNVSVGSVTGVSLSGVGDAISPAVCTLVSGLTNVSAAGGAVSYTATCSNVTAGGYLWKLDGATIAACTGSQSCRECVTDDQFNRGCDCEPHGGAGGRIALHGGERRD
ncbi:MAG: choice-of-anchor D domain-containing protein [Betaproteobacteria bacterium]|nr:MAG: choice-of-anchor D domain-containing protein [Betaproteobacteria bacterium]